MQLKAKEENLNKTKETKQKQLTLSERKIINEALAKIKTLEVELQTQTKYYENFTQTTYKALNHICTLLPQSPQGKDINDQIKLIEIGVNKIISSYTEENTLQQNYNEAIKQQCKG